MWTQRDISAGANWQEGDFTDIRNESPQIDTVSMLVLTWLFYPLPNINITEWPKLARPKLAPAPYLWPAVITTKSSRSIGKLINRNNSTKLAKQSIRQDVLLNVEIVPTWWGEDCFVIFVVNYLSVSLLMSHFPSFCSQPRLPSARVREEGWCCNIIIK